MSVQNGVTYDLYALVADRGPGPWRPIRCERASCFRPVLDSPGWAEAVAALRPSAEAVEAVTTSYVIEGTVGAGDFTLTVKVPYWAERPERPAGVPVAPPPGHDRWDAV